MHAVQRHRQFVDVMWHDLVHFGALNRPEKLRELHHWSKDDSRDIRLYRT